jgi:hypothetical protein
MGTDRVELSGKIHSAHYTLGGKSGPLPAFPTHCQVAPKVLRGISERCPSRVRFHHEILLEDGIGARSASCAAHLFEAAAGLLRAIMAAEVEPERVAYIRVSQVELERSNHQNPETTG